MPTDPHDADPWTALGDALRTCRLTIGAKLARGLRWLADALDELDR